jgi:phenylpropionate dioxygenase-like ring-hydroxylating dioxygenase large terminal subunit
MEADIAFKPIMELQPRGRSTMATKAAFISTPYSAYLHTDLPKEDEELTHVGPGTPCGEWFRRFWQPVALSEELKDLPKSITILGEELVAFRDKRGQVGLLELHCSHRGTSLEFGLIEEQGIRCCYHGWLFGVDGRILDTPGEPPNSTYKERLCHGAYPVQEYAGMVFAYMGPPDKKPSFFNYDTFHIPGYRIEVRGKAILPCNWLQVEDNILDPVHLSFLHTLSSGSQFLTEDGRPSNVFGILAELDWMETPRGQIYIATRRIENDVWVRIGEWIAPAHHIIPAHPNFPLSYHEGTDELYIRPKYTEWTVPINDTISMNVGYRHVPESDTGPVITNLATPYITDRTLEQKQRFPGDLEALEGQRPIAIHALEHLGATDRGVTHFRKMVRDGIRAVQIGQDPKGHNGNAKIVTQTIASDTVLPIPLAPTPEQDRQLLRDTGQMVANKLLNNSAHG